MTGQHGDGVTLHNAASPLPLPHVVVFLDFLGQTSKLNEWDFEPKDDEDDAVLRRACDESTKFILDWRKKFEQFFQWYEQRLREIKRKVVDHAPEGEHGFDVSRGSELRHHHFGDSLIFYSPLVNPNGYLQVDNVVTCLHVCGALFLEALACRVPLRGTVEIGMLSHLQEDEPFGPALANAYRLESKVAQYPRIVVSDRLAQYLKDRRARKGEYNQVMACECESWLYRDEDDKENCWSLNYLSDSFLKVEGLDQMRKDALLFVRGEVARFCREHKENVAQGRWRRAKDCTKLFRRYRKVDDYFAASGVTL